MVHLSGELAGFCHQTLARYEHHRPAMAVIGAAFMFVVRLSVPKAGN